MTTTIPTTKTKPTLHKKRFTLDNRRMSPKPTFSQSLKTLFKTFLKTMKHTKYIEITDLHNKKFGIEKGLAKAISEKELDKKYYQWVDKQKLSRDYDTALEERINKPLENNMLIVRNKDGSIKFDDRKLRYDWHENNFYTFYIGPTHFGENQATNIPCIKDKELCEYLKNEGIKNFNDADAYFANIVAVNATIETKEGYALMFRRSPDSEIFANYWHVIGRHVKTDLKLFEKKHPSGSYFKKLLKKQMLAELEEEISLKPEQLILTGFAHNFAGSDFTYIAKTGKTAEEILENSKNAQDLADHSSVKKLKPEELAEFLLNEEKIVPVGFGGTLLYLKHKNKTLYEKVMQESKNIITTIQ